MALASVGSAKLNTAHVSFHHVQRANKNELISDDI
jgi:hypothetical protein